MRLHTFPVVCWECGDRSEVSLTDSQVLAMVQGAETLVVCPSLDESSRLMLDVHLCLACWRRSKRAMLAEAEGLLS